MYRTKTCGQLDITAVGTTVILSGWVQRSRDLGGMTFIDLRDRYGITQLVFNMDTDAELCAQARKLGREFVTQIKGEVIERKSKNNKMATGDIEIAVAELNVLNVAKTPPFTIEDNTDGGDDIRAKYRYLDLRRNEVQEKIKLRAQVTAEVRNYLNKHGFLDIETPYLIKSTPEGARDFVVPSRMNPGQFYALPQSPQTFKQLLMVSGYDKYYQIVRCFRDEDLRADRQPEFTQIDCEMAFVHQSDVMSMFEGLIKHVFKTVKNIEFDFDFPIMKYDEAMENYGIDRPDLRFGMTFKNITETVKGKGFQVFDSAEAVLGIVAENCAHYTRKQLDEINVWLQRPQIGAKGAVWIKYETDGTLKSSVDKFYNQDDLKNIADKIQAKSGDLMLILAGALPKTRAQLCELRLYMGEQLGLRPKNVYKPLWVIDFPLVEWDEETQRYYACHHPFTSPKLEDIHLMDSDASKIRANAYDLVMNGTELGGGSIRIHDRNLQSSYFDLLGFSKEEAQHQFGFLLEAFEYGAPPHGGLAFGLDRLVATIGEAESIRDFIAFPKNNAGRDVMLDSPSPIKDEQKKELWIETTWKG